MAKHFVDYVRNDRSSRGGVVPSLLVLHTTEGHNRPGLSDLTGLVAFFDGPVQASAHFGVDAEGNSVRMVPDEQKSWTQGNMNPESLSVEMIGFAATTRRDWLRLNKNQLITTARIFAKWGKKYEIPMRRGSAPQCSVKRSGIVTHDQLGCGNFHTDPGKGFPMKWFIWRTRYEALVLRGHRGTRMAKRYLRACRVYERAVRA